MNNRSATIFTDYFFSTFMQHHKLYQFVFETDRQLTRFNSQVVVEAPVPPGELRDAKLPILHEYDQQLKAIQSTQEKVVEIEPYTDTQVKMDEEALSCTQTEVGF